VDAPLSMYLQPGSSTSSVQRYRCPTAQVSVNSHRPRADYSHDARLDVPPRSALQRLTKVQRGPVAGQSGSFGPSAGSLGPTRPPGASPASTASGTCAGVVVRARSEGSGHGLPALEPILPPSMRRSDPCIAIAIRASRSVQGQSDVVRCSLQRETQGTHALQTRARRQPACTVRPAGLHSSPAQFVQTTLCFERR
jgi:hypothetical protein